MIRIALHQRVGNNPDLADLVGVADVIHVTLGRREPRAVLRDDIDALGVIDAARWARADRECQE